MTRRNNLLQCQQMLMQASDLLFLMDRGKGNPQAGGAPGNSRETDRGNQVAIQQELEIPPLFIGTGEEPEQFDVFSRREFVEQVL